ncbi:MAG: hypothetical protein IID17_00795 [Nitrospinae bacterium]|nr:hypothetical protein [Nitrospinota bacterium]
MKILINGLEKSFSCEGETLGDLLDHILENETSQGNFFSNIRLNEKEVLVDSPEIRQTPLSQIETLETEILSLNQILEKNIINAQDYLKKLIPGVQKASDLFRSGNEQEANKFFINIIDGIDWFSQVVDSIAKAIDFESDTVIFDGKSFQDRQDHLVKMTRQMVEANQNQDWVLLADLLEYEILPYYTDWEEQLPKIYRKNN